jgi:hypothetical protein
MYLSFIIRQSSFYNIIHIFQRIYRYMIDNRHERIDRIEKSEIPFYHSYFIQGKIEGSIFLCPHERIYYQD